ncbi:histidine kinase [Egibacter rhizosphaerae]|uniref:Histidine kinase n=1 Tax=Egibacter rhizosphaerae TaxID=1670831 RepID=A0A411YBB2_9ACTN|nr:histidine kinase [Egibacter rhizosphaerae]QBI18494.1 histidine kinase [Egibacter rhizosphaerae]
MAVTGAGRVHGGTVLVGDGLLVVPDLTGSCALFTSIRDRCHPRTAWRWGIMKRMEPSPETTAPDGGPHRDRASMAGPAADTGTDLDRMRRQTRWSSLGIVYALGMIGIAAALATRPLGVGLGVAVAAAVAGSLAAGRLIDRRIAAAAATASPDEHAGDAPLVAVAVVAGLVYAVLAQVADAAPLPAVADEPEGSWFAVPAVANIAVVVTVAGRRWVLAGLLGGLVATVVAAAARFLIVGNLEWVWLVLEGGLVAGVAVASRAELRHWELVVRLERARQLEGALAVAEERLRFAADLHDIQGHHLQVIALKCELAGRVAASDPAAAAGHMAEAEDLARQALADTRGIVQGYRTASLGTELTNATRVLAAAGIDGRLSRDAQVAADEVEDPGRHLLGLVVREATTNVLRHSRADQARLALTLEGATARLDVRNNGANATGKATSPDGTGLATLAERLRAAGGALEWEHDDDWFGLTAWIPVGHEQLS